MANDLAEAAMNLMINYDQVFIWDFVALALACCPRVRTRLFRILNQIVQNFFLHTLKLQSWKNTLDCCSPGK